MGVNSRTKVDDIINIKRRLLPASPQARSPRKKNERTK